MSEAARHKQKARRYEQREDWKRAIEEYELAIEVSKTGREQLDINLYNRIGDLYRRIGDVGKAVSFYEAAADAHMQAGFYNNAIALCNKILRTMPSRHSIHLKLGKIGAAKGFLSDARKHFLEYAEHMQRSGQLEKAFDALIEFADISPDTDIRLMIADQLLEHGLSDQAVEQLRLAWRDLQSEGRETDAQAVRERILEMAPDRDPEVDPPAAGETVTGVDAEGVIDLPELEPYPYPGDEEQESADVEPVDDIVPTTLDEETDDEDDLAAAVEGDLEILPTSLAADEEVAEGEPKASPPVDELEPTSVVPDAEEPDEEDAGVELPRDEEAVDLSDLEPVTELPESLTEGPDSGVDAPSPVEPTAELPEVEEGAAPDTLPTEPTARPQPHVKDELEDTIEPKPADPGEELPIIEPPVTAEDEAPTASHPSTEMPEVPEAAPAPVERVQELRERLQEGESQPAVNVELADALLEVGERIEAVQHLRDAVELYEERGEMREALRVIEELLYLNRNDVRSYQKRVELALKMGDRATLLEAYLDLADCLDRTEASDKAQVVYARVLELDGENRRARAALEMLGSAASSAPATGKAAAGGSPEEFAELAALVSQEQKSSANTRFTVPAQEPESEEEVNFATMLDQFKSKVAESIEQEDSESHYDLGVAFKEMGLVDEAIAEFQIAARSREYRLRAMEMLGACFLEKGEHRIALKVLDRVVQAPEYNDEELIGIFYGMGRAHEALGEEERALEFYERVLGCDIHFADVAERVSTLRA